MYKYKNKSLLSFSSLLFLGLISGCSGSGHDDLKIFMDEVNAKGGSGNIESIPTFSPYKPFDYSATLLRAPFDRPVVILNPLELSPQDTVKPDANRPKEYLEGFSIESLTMVGTLEQHGEFFALINDDKGSVHYVKEGNYLGKNHGRIVRATPTNIQMLEIISAGGGWLERPRTLELQEVEGE